MRKIINCGEGHGFHHRTTQTHIVAASLLRRVPDAACECNKLRSRIDSLPGSAFAKELLNTLDSGALSKVQYEEVETYLRQLKTDDGISEEGQCTLLVLVFFGMAGKVSPDLRLQAYAMLYSRGPEEGKKVLCEHFRGFYERMRTEQMI